MNPLFIKDKYAALKQGYPVYINVDRIRAFTAKTGADIPFGTLLVRTDEHRVYEGATNLADDVITDANQIVGINMATNVKLQTTYGDDTSATLKGGQQGDNAQEGEIAVPFVGDAPIENDPVYVITAAGTDEDAEVGYVTKDSTESAALGDKLELPQFRFTGLTDTETGLTVLKKLY